MNLNEITNPFPGLRFFSVNDANLFFGREGQSDELLRRLHEKRFVAVVGTSGSGKSSLVHAGLLPALYGGLMASTVGSNWRVALFRPGNDPIGNLARALNDSGQPSSEAAGDAAMQATFTEVTLRRSSLGLVEYARQLGTHPLENLLVVVDQFEELFRFNTARSDIGDDAAAFVKLLLEAARQREHPVYIVLTMRSDFLGDCSTFWDLPEAINEGQYLIPRMTRDQRRMAITGPVAVAGGETTPRLVNRLLNDVGDSPDQLPIMQHALMRTWVYWQQQHRPGEPLDLPDYEVIGAMISALSLHADEAYHELDERGQFIAERIFKALTERGADNREYRRPTRLRELYEVIGASREEVVAVIENFRREGRSFLMPPVGVQLEDETVVDISHESLIRNWERLRCWVDEEAQSAREYRRVAEAAVLYSESKEGLLTDPALQIALNWHEEARPNKEWAMRYHPEFDAAINFLMESKKMRAEMVSEQERLRQEEAKQERRLLEQTQAYAENQRRAARRLKWLTVALYVILFLTVGVTIEAFRSRSLALEAKGEVESQRMRAEVALLEAQDAKKEAEFQRQKAEDALREAQEIRNRLEMLLASARKNNR